MIKHSPTVSVCLPVYNGERYVRETIDSVLAQTFDDLELVISDNASTDRTREIWLERVPPGEVPDKRQAAATSLSGGSHPPA
jgi:GT2 family glycosyltransferase